MSRPPAGTRIAHHHHDPAIVPTRRRAFAFDMDGVMYRGSELIDGAIEAVATVQTLGLPLFFVTNNSRESPIDLAGKLQGLGVDAGPEQIISAVVATVDYLKRLDAKPEPILVLGAEELGTQIAAAGFRLASFHDREPVDLVVAGVDFNLTYARLSRAVQALVTDGAHFIAVNEDPLYPTPTGPTPGAGAITAALTGASGVHPVVVGKPSPHLFRAVLERSGVAAEDLIVVGDMLQADIAGANAIGSTGVLVLTGTTSRDEAETASDKLRPHFIIDNLWQLPFEQLLTA